MTEKTLQERLQQIADHDWRISFLAHTSDTALEAKRRLDALEAENAQLVKGSQYYADRIDVLEQEVIDLDCLAAGRTAQLAEAREALMWAMDEVDVLSNKLCGFAYPQGMSFVDRAEQEASYCSAVRVRKASTCKEGTGDEHA